MPVRRGAGQMLLGVLLLHAGAAAWVGHHGRTVAPADDLIQPRPANSNKETVCLIQYDDRKETDPIPPALRVLPSYNRKLCAASEGCSYIGKNSSSMDLPVYWSKVAAVKDVVEEHSKERCAAFFFMDTDAVLTAEPVELLHLFNDSSMVITTDDPGGQNQAFNAGVFGFRNNRKAHDILKSWLSFFAPARWAKDHDRKWKCTLQDLAHTECPYAGTFYEQGAFADFVLKGQYEGDIKTVSWAQLNHMGCETDPSILVHHFMNKNPCEERYRHIQGEQDLFRRDRPWHEQNLELERIIISIYPGHLRDKVLGHFATAYQESFPERSLIGEERRHEDGPGHEEALARPR